MLDSESDDKYIFRLKKGLLKNTYTAKFKFNASDSNLSNENENSLLDDENEEELTENDVEETTENDEATTTEETTTSEPSQLLNGDYNADGEVTIADAVLLARFVGEDTTLTGEQINGILDAEPDYNSDRLVTILDVHALLKKLETE